MCCSLVRSRSRSEFSYVFSGGSLESRPILSRHRRTRNRRNPQPTIPITVFDFRAYSSLARRSPPLTTLGQFQMSTKSAGDPMSDASLDY